MTGKSSSNGVNSTTPELSSNTQQKTPKPAPLPVHLTILLHIRQKAPLRMAIGIRSAFRDVRESIKKQIEALIDAYQDVVFRAKGFLFAEHWSNSELLQFSAGRLHWQPALRSPQETRLVFIGVTSERFSEFERSINAAA